MGRTCLQPTSQVFCLASACLQNLLFAQVFAQNFSFALQLHELRPLLISFSSGNLVSYASCSSSPEEGLV